MEGDNIPEILIAKRGGFYEVDYDFIGCNTNELYESIDAESHDEFIRRQNEKEEK